MTYPKWLSACGGPNALSIWTWLASVVFTVSITGIVEPLQAGSFNLPWLAAVVTSQAILGIGVWFAITFVLPKEGQAPRPLAVFATLVLLGAIRAVTMQAGSELSDYNDGFSITERLVFGVGFSVVFGIVLALVVDGARTHISTMQQLRGAQEIVTNETRSDERQLDQLHEGIVSHVQQQLLDALSQSDLKPQMIRAWARDIVRPLSHELAEVARNRAEVEPAMDLPRVKVYPWERAQQVAASMRPPSAIALVAIAESLAFLVLLEYESLLVALAHVSLGSVFILLTMWLFGVLYRPTRHYLLNAASIALGLTAVAVISVVGTDLLVRFLSPASDSYRLYIVSIVFLGLTLSIHRAVREIQNEAEANLTETVSRLTEHRQRVQASLRSAQASASRFLHDSIQGILYAGALSGAQPADIRQDVVRAFREFAEPVTHPTRDQQRARLDQLIEMWDQAFPVEACFNDSVVTTILDDPELTDRLIDVLSEGLTNAAKHSLASGAVVSIDQLDNAIIVTVTTPGCLADRAAAGLGTRSLTNSSAHWTLQEESHSTVLTAHLT